VREAAVNGQLVPQDECSPNGGLHCAIDERVVEHNQVRREVVTADPVPNSEEAGSWYYVVDCATCKAVIPFKHAPEGEPILRFPTMGVRCFQCRTVHTYAADLVSHRKAVAPCGVQLDKAPEIGQEASRYQQEDRSDGDTGQREIVECKIEPVTSSLQRDVGAIAAVSGKREVIFFLSSCLFATGLIFQPALNIDHPAPPAHSYGSAALLYSVYFGTVLCGLALFIFGMSRAFVDTYAFKSIFLRNHLLAVITSNALVRFLTTWINSSAKPAIVSCLTRQTRRTLSPVVSVAATFRSRIKRRARLRLTHYR
jgi:hypothetical protein